MLVQVTGCGGCRPDQNRLTKEELEKQAREQRESLVMSDMLSLPTDSDSKVMLAKPGHWFETKQQFKSNREDMQVVAVGSIARGAQLSRLPGTDVINEYVRRTSLPKGQTKTLDLQYFVPFTGEQADPYEVNPISQRLNFRTELLSWPLMSPILPTPVVTPANEMKPNEFVLAVLSPQTLGYEFLTVQDAVYWRGDDLLQSDRVRSYWVTLVKPQDNQYALPHSMLTMTAMAVMVWDDVSADDLSLEQQRAIVDWVHWGGQLIVSGPSSWARLQASFLSPYLPADSGTSTELTTDDFAELSNTWMAEDRAAPEAAPEPLQVLGSPIGGLRFELNGRGQWLPGSGELVAEAAVGRGRIVLTGFPLRDPRIYRWKYFSSFLSSGLLRRPARTVSINPLDRSVSQIWAPPFSDREYDPRLHSNFRILSRDLPLSVDDEASPGGGPPAAQRDEIPQTLSGPANTTAPPPRSSARNATSLVLNTPVPSRGGSKATGTNEAAPASAGDLEAARWSDGGSMWNDYSGFSFEVLTALKAAAGIELPSRETILYLLAGYLTCLVPLNWLVFRLVGRLEFAWLAAPVLALVGVAVVTKVARLDIGFARRTTEISILELHGDYPRGHLTEYVALYTSLSTNYAIEFPEDGSVALPLGDLSRARRRAVEEVRNLRTNYGQSAGVTLEPLTVYSNSTEMVHAEQMVDVGGGLVLGSSQAGLPAVKNETTLSLKAGLVLRCPEPGNIEIAWVGELPQGQSRVLEFIPATEATLSEGWNSQPSTAADPPAAEEEDAMDSLWIGGLLRELVRLTPLAAGQTRLIAYTDDRPGELQVNPREDQYDGRCVVVAHLTPARFGPVTPDLAILGRNVSGTDAVPIELEDDAAAGASNSEAASTAAELQSPEATTP